MRGVLGNMRIKVRISKKHSNEAALSLRSRRSGTKFAAPNRTAH